MLDHTNRFLLYETHRQLIHFMRLYTLSLFFINRHLKRLLTVRGSAVLQSILNLRQQINLTFKIIKTSDQTDHYKYFNNE